VKKEERGLMVGLDIGTSKIAALVAEAQPDGTHAILGLGSHPCEGLRKGVVVDIERTVASIQRALEEAELIAGCKIASAVVGIAGGHVRSFNSTGMVVVKDREVTRLDVERAIETARAVNVPADQQILHVLRQEFTLDGQEEVREPVGMSGVRLEVKVHIVTGAVSAVQNLVKCVRRCGLEVADLVLQSLASARAVLSDDERDLGVALVDIGGGTTDVAVFARGAIRYTAVIPIAGDHITNDIAMALRTPGPEAEAIKLRHGVALRQRADANERIEVPGIGERPPRTLSRQTLAEVIEPRVEELFGLVQKVLRDSGYEEVLTAGVVLTGGSALLPGIVELGEEIFHMPVRVGVPRAPGQLAEVLRTPRYATAYGLVLDGISQWQSGRLARQDGSLRAVLGRMREWFQRNF